MFFYLQPWVSGNLVQYMDLLSYLPPINSNLLSRLASRTKEPACLFLTSLKSTSPLLHKDGDFGDKLNFTCGIRFKRDAELNLIVWSQAAIWSALAISSFSILRQKRPPDLHLAKSCCRIFI